MRHPAPRRPLSAARRRALVASTTAWLLYFPAFVVLALSFWAFVDHAWSVVSFPYQLDYGEMPELNRAWLLAHGQPIYVDWSHPPYQMANYPPLYSAVAAVGVTLRGTQFFTGRLISLASTVAAGACIAAIAAALGAAWRPALLAGLLYFAGYPVWNWGAFQRVDAFAVALELIGVAMFTAGWVRARRGCPRQRAAAVWATVPLFLAAVYARQTVVAGAFACYAYLLTRRPRLGGAVVAAYAAGGLASLGALELATGGQFWRHIVDGNLNRWSWARVDFYWQPFWRVLHWTFPLAGMAVVAAIARRQAQVPLLYLLASAATALTIGKIGANVNYLLQLWAAVALLAGLACAEIDRLAAELAGLRRPAGPTRTLAHLAPALSALPVLWLLVGLQQAFHVPYIQEGQSVRVAGPAALFAHMRWARWPLWRLDPWAAPPGELPTYYVRVYRENPSPGEREAAHGAHAYVAAVAGDVLGEEMSFSVTTGKRIYLQPFEFTQRAEQGAWDQWPLLREVRQRRFAVVVLRFRLGDDPAWRRERLNQPLLDALVSAYRLDATFGTYFLYRPQ